MYEQSTKNQISKDQVTKLLSEIETMIPDMDDYNSDPIASYGLNACTAVCDLLEFLSDQNQNHIYSICDYYTDTIDIRINDLENASIDQVDEHPEINKSRNFVLAKLQ